MLKNEAEILIPLDENQYEWVELPSRGECYPHKKSKVPVAYMTAMDENIIVSEKLRSQRKVSETLLERKILDKSFNVKDLCIADRDAILIWLRKTSYGNKYKITEVDENGKRHETVIDLDKVTYSEFNYFGDEDGYFEYLTKKGDEIKYRLLTHGIEEEVLDKILEMPDSDAGKEGGSVWDIIKLMMAKQTVSINGNNDTDYVISYINKMNDDELAAYLSFVTHNTPRVNIDIRIGDSFFYDIK